MLRNLKTTDPEFWDELTQKTRIDPEEPLVGEELEDDDILEPQFEDDSNLLCNVIVANVLGSESDGVEANINGDLVSTGMAESLDNVELPSASGEMSEIGNSQELGCGKKKVD
jgi:hypothetical protein